MRKRIPTTLACLILILSMLCFSTSAAGTEQTVEPRYTGISTFTAGLTISAGEAWCRSSSTLSSTSYSQTLTMRLQRSVNESVWTTVQSWTGSNSFNISLSETRSITHGYYYRLYCTANVYTSSGSWYGSNTKITDSQYY